MPIVYMALIVMSAVFGFHSRDHEVKHLEDIQKATVEACGKSWLQVPIDQGIVPPGLDQLQWGDTFYFYSPEKMISEEDKPK